MTMAVSAEIRRLQGICEDRGINYHHRNSAETLNGLLVAHDAEPPKMKPEIHSLLKHMNRWSATKSNVLRAYINELLENAR